MSFMQFAVLELVLPLFKFTLGSNQIFTFMLSTISLHFFIFMIYNNSTLCTSHMSVWRNLVGAAIVCQTIIPRMCGFESRYECNAPVCRCFFIPTFFTETEFLYALQSTLFSTFPIYVRSVNFSDILIAKMLIYYFRW